MKAFQNEPARLVGQVKALLFFAAAMGFQIDGNTQAEIVSGVGMFASILASEIVRARVSPVAKGDVVKQVEHDAAAVAVDIEHNPVHAITYAQSVATQFEQGVEHARDEAAAFPPAPRALNTGTHPTVLDPESPHATDPNGPNTPPEHAFDVTAQAAQPSMTADELANIGLKPTTPTATGSTPASSTDGAAK